MLDYLKTHTVAATAIKFGMSPTTVRRRARRAGVINIRAIQIRDSINIQELEHYFRTHTLQECSVKFGIQPRYLAKRLRSIGVDTTIHSSMSGIDVDINKLKEHFNSHTLGECAKEFNCSLATIKRKLKDAGADTSIHNHSELAYQRFLETRKDVSFLTKEFLHKEYVVENKDAHLIAEENKVHFNTVLMKLREYELNVKTRERVAESLMIKHHKKTGYWWPGQMPDVLEKVFRLRSKYLYDGIKSDKPYLFKSLHELCFALVLDHDDNVVKWNYEKVVVPYVGEGGRNRLYYVDFDVICCGGHHEWVEVKPNWHMIPQNKELYANVKAASVGATFKGIDDQIRNNGYKLFLDGYNQHRITFKNPDKLLAHKSYTLWFKDKGEHCIEYRHRVERKEVGKYVRYQFMSKNHTPKIPKNPISAV